MSRVDISGRLDPQMAAAVAKEQELAPGTGDTQALALEELRALYRQGRAWWNADAPALPRVREAEAPGPLGAIPLRLYHPCAEGSRPGLVYLHGGGWVVGDLDTHDKIARLLALNADVAVIAVDYRLAPEHKFPSQLEEALAVLQHLESAGAAWDVEVERLAIGGDSAGANLSLAACQAVKAERPGLLRAALLYYGAFGLRDSVSRRKYGGPEDGVGEADLAFYVDSLIRMPEDLRDPRFDLLNSDLAGLPPLFLAAAELDPLLDDSLALTDLLEDAGIEHRLEVYPGMLHGFLQQSRMVEMAGKAIDDSARWLRERIAG